MGLSGWLRRQGGLARHRMARLGQPWFTCPICRYRGPFRDRPAGPGTRRHAICASCGSFERHRLQYLVLERVAEQYELSRMAMLHFAPESWFRLKFSKMFASYETADLLRNDVDRPGTDLTRLPFAGASYDCVWASHVLEHIADDGRALSEIRRVLRPGGVAVLPVPIVNSSTVEYDAPNPHEFGHVRAPGPDYYDRYAPFFARVDRYDSTVFPERFQTYIYEDRSRWPTAELPQRQTAKGDRHIDIVPVCLA